MAEKKKSIIEEALLDANRIQEALNSNTKEILRSIAREEIDGLVKESLYEDDYEEEDVDSTEELDLDDTAGEELSGEEPSGEESGEEELELDAASDDYEEAGMDDTEDSEMNYGGEEESGEDYELDMTSASDEDVISVYKKLSGDDEIEVVSDNEVHIKDPVSGSEYHIKLGGAGEAEEELAPEMGLGLDMGMEDEYEDASDTEATYEEGIEEGVVYEVTLDEEEVSENEEITEETSIGATANGKLRTATSDVTMGKEASAPNTGDIEGQKAPVGNEKDDNWAGDNLQGGFDDDGKNGSGNNHADHIMEDETLDENEETVTEEDEVTENEEVVDETKYVGGKVEKVATAHTNQKLEETVKKYNRLLAEARELKKENEEFRGALNKFRTMLGETVVFNTNLTNVTRLFTEHSTTKEEKESIIARFDNEVTTIKESKRLYKTIATELGNKKPILESIENKFSREAGSGVSKQLNENTAYVDASTQRIMDLIKRVETPRD